MNRNARSPPYKGGFIRTRIHVMAQKLILNFRQRSVRQLKAIIFLSAIAIFSKVLLVGDSISAFNPYLQHMGRNITSKPDRSHVTGSISIDGDKKCALLFFGLIKDSFRSISLPSIKRNIVDQNPQCDIYVHTYNLIETPQNKRNAELLSHKLNVSEAYLLTNNVVLEDMASFQLNRGEFLNHSRKFYHHGWGRCCVSHDNMIKQWNSIQGVWDLMQSTLDDKYGTGNKSGNKEKSFNYDQVGLFRSDVYYTRPINIYDSQGAVPNFALHHGYNDRLFYGLYENAEIWASKRFDFVATFENKYMQPFDKSKRDWQTKISAFFGHKYKDGYHSESFVKMLMDHYGVRVELKDHCLWRVRSGQKILVADCYGMDGFSTFDEVRSYRPKVKESGTSWSMVVD